jgi:hypothetical protein
VVTGGVLQRIGSHAAFTYLFLCAVGNTQGVSFWSQWRIAQTLGLPLDAVEAAIQKLSESDLIATNGKTIQVLPLQVEGAASGPLKGKSVVAGTSASAPCTVKTDSPWVVADLDESEIERHEAEARRQLSKISPRATPEGVRRVARALALDARRDQRG